MTQFNTDQYDDPNDDATETPPEENPNLRQLRKKADKYDEVEGENVDLKRENAFLKAGINTEDALGAMFAKAYDGELTTDSIKAAFAEVGGAQASEAETTDEPKVELSDGERQSTRERELLAAGGQGDTGNTPKEPVKGADGRAVKAFETAMQQGAPREDAAGVGFAEIVGAANEGDHSVILPRGGRYEP